MSYKDARDRIASNRRRAAESEAVNVELDQLRHEVSALRERALQLEAELVELRASLREVLLYESYSDAQRRHDRDI
jgi:predicted  nucleic acid-binding Zn-ribbon protein